MAEIKWKRGNELSWAAQNEAKRLFINRHTKDHLAPWSNGRYAVQFASDEDWLANSWFPTKTDGTLDARARYCQSNPTWPDNPELRRDVAAPAPAWATHKELPPFVGPLPSFDEGCLQ